MDKIIEDEVIKDEAIKDEVIKDEAINIIKTLGNTRLAKIT